MPKNNKVNRRKSAVIPPVGNGGIKKKQHGNNPAPSIIVSRYPQPDPFQIPGYPVFNFPVRLDTDPPAPPPRPILLPTPYQHPLPPPPPIPPLMRPPLIPPTASGPFMYPPPPFPPPFIAPRPPGVSFPPVLVRSPRSLKRKKAPVTVAVQSVAKGAVTESITKKAQLKYAKQLAARANKRKSTTPVEVKTEPVEPAFNLFMNIAQRYRSVQKSPDAIDIPDDSQDEEGEVEEIEQNAAAAASNMTIEEDMSICTVDEVGEQTMPVREEEEGGKEGEEKGEEDKEEEIVCLGEQKTNHVMSDVIVIGESDDSDVEEMEDVSSECSAMNRAFTHTEEGARSEKKKRKSSTRVMDQSIICLSVDDDDREKVASGAELPEFIPLIDGEKKSQGKSKGRYHHQNLSVQQKNGDTQQTQSGSSSSEPSSTPFVWLTRQKGPKNKTKKDTYRERKQAEARAIAVGASPATVARAVAASTCTIPDILSLNIPLPQTTAPPTPLARLWSCPPGSSPAPSSAMGLIQSRGLSTSAPQSQPVNFGDYGMVHPRSSLIGGVGGASSSPTTLAAVLHDEAVGVVRDALTASGIYRRQWEEKWISPGMSHESRADVKVDPCAAPFRICSYNVLCQKTIAATQYLYRHARFQPHVLEWSHRWPLIQKELSELNADVFGLQEIQDVHFEEYYEPFMKSLGYVCLYQRKTESIHSDGLGIFVRANRFKITSVKTVDFLVPGDNLMNRGNVAQLLRVECLQTGASLIISNTHIIFNEKRGDIKLAQIALLMANIHAIRQEDEPVVCLGDWNLEPASDLYNYITSGRLDANQFVAKYGSGQLREGRNFNIAPMRELPMDTHLKTRMSREGILYQNEGALLQSLQRTQPSLMCHQIPLTSTYAPYQERHVSTFHKDIANPDFIFYSTAGRGEAESRRLRLIRRLAVPPEMNIREQLEPWPNHHVPSDHIPLMAEFYLSK